jgi:tetratricopeptide (TPR) repeat protein
MNSTSPRISGMALSLLALLMLNLSGCFEGSPSGSRGLDEASTTGTGYSSTADSTEGVAPSRVKEASTLNEEAVSLLEAGKAEEAIKTLEKAYTLAPKNRVISENMARAMEANNQLPKARDAYENLSLMGELHEAKRATYLLRAVDLNIKLAEQSDENNKWNERKVNDVLMRLSTAVDEETYVERVDILRGFYNIDPKANLFNSFIV